MSHCIWCDGSGAWTESCGGDRHDMWLCYKGHCNINHKTKQCDYCNPKDESGESNEYE